MLGMLLTDRECKELDEMLLDLQDSRLDPEVRQSIARRYRVVFRMYARFASPKELSRYVLNLRTDP